MSDDLPLYIFSFLIGLVVGVGAHTFLTMPQHGDTKFRDGSTYEYRCNWAGCGWFEGVRGK